jgi:CheY-like chemotaxis protein
MALEMPVILVVEDEELNQSLVEETLGDGGFEPVIATSGGRSGEPVEG